jgi:hypothetical protein
MLSATPGTFGQNTVALLAEHRTDAVRSSATIVLSVGDPHVRAIVTRLLDNAAIGPLEEWL